MQSIRVLILACVLVAWSLPAMAGPTVRVASGESIQEALDAAEVGAVIEVEAGEYHEALTVDTPGITLRGIVNGESRPVLDGRGELNDGVIASGSPFAMTGFAIRHYKGNGVTTQGVDGVYLSDLVIDDTGLYGVYPVASSNVTVTHCTVTKISDAGIYVGESRGALVAYNEVHHNVAGIEIENTNDAVVRDNLVTENTAGILAFVLPNKLLKEGRRTVIERNWVVRNNTPNFGDPNSIVGGLPHGIGLMVMGADQTTLRDNWVKGNDSVGIAVLRLAPDQAEKDTELEPLSDGTRVEFNYVASNGLRPHPIVLEGYGRGADIAWDGTGTDNCADLPDSATRAGAPLGSCLDVPERPEAEAPAPPDGKVPPQSAAPARAEELPEGAAVVRIRGMRYEPRHLEVTVGQPVVWINEDGVPHTVTSGEGIRPTAAPLASPFLQKGERFVHRFEKIGRYEYLCLPHLNQAPMRGATVTVAK